MYVGTMTIDENVPLVSVIMVSVNVYATFPLAWSSCKVTSWEALNPVPVTFMTLLSSGVTVRDVPVVGSGCVIVYSAEASTVEV